MRSYPSRRASYPVFLPDRPTSPPSRSGFRLASDVGVSNSGFQATQIASLRAESSSEGEHDIEKDVSQGHRIALRGGWP